MKSSRPLPEYFRIPKATDAKNTTQQQHTLLARNSAHPVMANVAEDGTLQLFISNLEDVSSVGFRCTASNVVGKITSHVIHIVQPTVEGMSNDDSNSAEKVNVIPLTIATTWFGVSIAWKSAEDTHQTTGNRCYHVIYHRPVRGDQRWISGEMKYISFAYD